MTVIAWDGTTLAADKLMCCGNTKKTVTKIFKKDIAGECCLLAITGNLSVGMETLDWYLSGAHCSEYPPANRSVDSGASLIVIKKDGSVLKYESSPSPFKNEGPFCAFGSGEETALAAMECGANAQRAVEVTCKYNAGCGNGIDTLTL